MIRQATNTLVAVTCACFLTGCTSKDSEDYLPQSVVYGVFNADLARQSAGMNRLLEFGDKVQGSTGLTKDVVRVGFAVEGMGKPGELPNMFAVVRGKDGAAEKVLASRQSAGGTASTVNGLAAVKDANGEGQILRLNDANVIGASNAAGVQRMFATAQGKAPRAANDSAYKTVEQIANTAPLAVVVKLEEVLKSFGTMLDSVPGPMKQGMGHLRNVKIMVITVDWREYLEATVTLNTADPTQAKGLLDFINGVLLIARTSGANLEIMKSMTMVVEGANLKISQKTTKAQSDAFLAKLGDIETRLPKEVSERGRFLMRELPQLMRPTPIEPTRPRRVNEPQ